MARSVQHFPTMRSERGFTILELCVVFAIAAALATIGAWRMTDLFAHWRTGDAARRFAIAISQAQAFALQHNRPVELVIDCDEDAPAFELRGSTWAPDGSLVDTIFERIPIAETFPGVLVGTEGLSGEMSCPAEDATFELEADRFASVCGEDNPLRFLPAGGLEVPGGENFWIAFLPGTDRGSGRQDRVRVVGVENVSARTRIFEREGGTWICP